MCSFINLILPCSTHIGNSTPCVKWLLAPKQTIQRIPRWGHSAKEHMQVQATHSLGMRLWVSVRMRLGDEELSSPHARQGGSSRLHCKAAHTPHGLGDRACTGHVQLWLGIRNTSSLSKSGITPRGEIILHLTFPYRYKYILITMLGPPQL